MEDHKEFLDWYFGTVLGRPRFDLFETVKTGIAAIQYSMAWYAEKAKWERM